MKYKNPLLYTVIKNKKELYIDFIVFINFCFLIFSWGFEGSQRHELV